MRTDSVPIGGAHNVKPDAIQVGLNGFAGSRGTFLGRLVRRLLTHLIGDLVEANGRGHELLGFSFSTRVLAGDAFKIVGHLPDCTEHGPWRAPARELLRSADRLARGRLARSGRCHSRRVDARPRAPRRRVPAGRQPKSGAAGGGGDGSAGDGGGGGSDPAEPGGDGDPDPEAPAVESRQSVVCRGGRHGS
jgi:hypothetical protein